MYTRVILAIAAYHDNEIEQMDVVIAFLNADVVSKIYMEQPQGFKRTSKDGGELVCELKKALYGIREASRAWNSLLNEWLLIIGFNQSKVDPTVYTVVHKSQLYILAVYVGDCIRVGKRGPFILNFKKCFSTRFQIEDLRPASRLLGCRIERDRSLNGILRIKQDQYITDILDEFDMSNATVAGTPMAANNSMEPSTDLLDKKILPLSKLIGKLLIVPNLHDRISQRQ